jgi:hypothetical protein
MKRVTALLLIAGGLFAADLNGKWNFVWQTPGGERRSTLIFTVENDKVKVQFPEGKSPLEGTFRDNKLTLAGAVYSSEAGEEAAFRMSGTLAGEQLQGTATWKDHEMTFTARRAD